MELVISFSGGKDSSAMLAFLCEKYPHIKKHVVFADTGWEHPDAEEWCRKIVGMFDLPLHVVKNKRKTLLTMVQKRKMFPGMTKRQCTSDLKRDPVHSWIKNNVKDKLVVSCMGIRSEESTDRAKQKRLVRNKRVTNSRRTMWDWQPIKDWTKVEVLAYLELKGVPLHPVYQYLDRFSCRVCIFMTEHNLQQVAKHDPEAIEIISVIEKEIDFTMFQKGPIKQLINVYTYRKTESV